MAGVEEDMGEVRMDMAGASVRVVMEEQVVATDWHDS